MEFLAKRLTPGLTELHMLNRCMPEKQHAYCIHSNLKNTNIHNLFKTYESSTSLTCCSVNSNLANGARYNGEKQTRA